MRHFTKSRIIVMSGMLVLAACGSSGSGNKSQGSGPTNQVGTSSTVRSGTSAGPGPSASAGGANSSATAEVAAAVQQAHTAERTALATYENVVAKFGDRNPFVNVIESERQHVATDAKVATDHSITLSTASVNGNVAPATFSEACIAGVTTERQMIAMYDQLLPKVTAYPDITTAFTSLRQSSQDNHLAAFQRCS